MSKQALKEAVENSAPKDEFENGDVIRWNAQGGPSGAYIYAAIKTPAGWFTTARSGNPYVPQTIDFEDLLEIVARSETRDVMVVKEWELID